MWGRGINAWGDNSPPYSGSTMHGLLILFLGVCFAFVVVIIQRDQERAYVDGTLFFLGHLWLARAIFGYWFYSPPLC